MNEPTLTTNNLSIDYKFIRTEIYMPTSHIAQEPDGIYMLYAEQYSRKCMWVKVTSKEETEISLGIKDDMV